MKDGGKRGKVITRWLAGWLAGKTDRQLYPNLRWRIERGPKSKTKVKEEEEEIRAYVRTLVQFLKPTIKEKEKKFIHLYLVLRNLVQFRARWHRISLQCQSIIFDSVQHTICSLFNVISIFMTTCCKALLAILTSYVRTLVIRDSFIPILQLYIHKRSDRRTDRQTWLWVCSRCSCSYYVHSIGPTWLLVRSTLKTTSSAGSTTRKVNRATA